MKKKPGLGVGQVCDRPGIGERMLSQDGSPTCPTARSTGRLMGAGLRRIDLRAAVRDAMKPRDE